MISAGPNRLKNKAELRESDMDELIYLLCIDEVGGIIHESTFDKLILSL